MSAKKAKLDTEKVKSEFREFGERFEPVEAKHPFVYLTDQRTGARYCECHILASKLIRLGTIDVPLDPEEQADYRANREIVENASAYTKMKEDAVKKRAFSNIVAEYNKQFDSDHPLKIIGGQHRFEAIRQALQKGIDEYHGVKVYLDLDMEQRLDVQLISNTAIAISGDLFDRMHETVKGPKLRNWCQAVGFLEAGQDFADRRIRTGPITVQIARTFISNFFKGKEIGISRFEVSDTTPVLCPTGQFDSDWDELLTSQAGIWDDGELFKVANGFVRLIRAQRSAFAERKPKPPADYPEKAMNAGVLSAWAYTAGLLQNNQLRLGRHFSLADATGRDPLNAAALAKGRHKTDLDSYRGLGYRTDPKERGRLVELFYVQAEDGKGITTASVDIAIKKYHAKQAQLEVLKAQAKDA
jgi:hypothetical protein